MESLQEKALVEALYISNGDNDILKRMLIHTIDFGKLSIGTIFDIWLRYSDIEEINNKIPSKNIKEFEDMIGGDDTPTTEENQEHYRELCEDVYGCDYLTNPDNEYRWDSDDF